MLAPFHVLAVDDDPSVRQMIADYLGDNDIEVTSIHNFTLHEQPRTLAVHFWANNDAARVAKGLRAALDKIGVAKK